jgi:hypothetical protein
MSTPPLLLKNSAIRRPHESLDSPSLHGSGSNGHATNGTLRALEHIRRMRGGSQSHFIRCSDENYYVVKFQNNPQHRRILVNELLGTKLAAHLGLPTTPVAIINVSKDLILLTPDLHVQIPWTAGRGRIPCQSGFQFGSCYPGNPHRLTIRDFLPDKQLLSSGNLQDFLGILVFDLWTCNVDARQVIFGRKEVGTPYQWWMIDQGSCFNGGEWNFPDKPRRNLYDRKVVYEQVHGIETFEPWLARLESEKVARVLWAIAKTIPREWYEFDSASFHRLLEQLDSRRCRVRELLWAVRESAPLAFPKWIDGSNHVSKPVAKSHKRSTPPVLLQVQRRELDPI